MLEHEEILSLIDGMAQALRKRDGIDNALLIGIHTGGAWVEEHLHQALGNPNPLGSLDISFYRDDFTRIGINPQVRPSSIPFDIDDRHIILVDDVLFTGRTVRAALNELFDYGRPASVTLVVLIERDGLQLPVSAACSGMHVELESGQQIKLGGPDPMSLEIIEAS